MMNVNVKLKKKKDSCEEIDMAHNIYINEDNKAAFAFTGSRGAVWHGLGQELEKGAPIEVWREQAGMNWDVLESDVRYSDGKVFPGKKALFRSDNQRPLSIVGMDFKVVQPNEVLEFFRDLTEQHGMILSTAGCLFGGQRFWALAETGREGQVTKGDTIKAHLLFMTGVDGTISSSAKFVSTRVVCNNTLTIAMNESTKHIVRKTHRSIWNSQDVKIDLGILDANWELFMTNLKMLSEKTMSDDQVKGFFEKTFFDPEREEQGWGAERKVNTLMDLYYKGDGADYAYGTAYGALNAITNLYTHGTGSKKSKDRIFSSAYYDNDKIKNAAFNDLLEIC